MSTVFLTGSFQVWEGADVKKRWVLEVSSGFSAGTKVREWPALMGVGQGRLTEEECGELGEEASPSQGTAHAEVWSLAHFEVSAEESGLC